MTDLNTGKSYRKINAVNSRDYDTNQEICEQNGGYLPEPRSLEEKQFLMNFTSNSGGFYLGMTDRVEEGVFQWNSDNSTVTWTDWYPGDPNGGTNDNCVFVYGVNWADYPCVNNSLITGPIICQGIYLYHLT